MINKTQKKTRYYDLKVSMECNRTGMAPRSCTNFLSLFVTSTSVDFFGSSKGIGMDRNSFIKSRHCGKYSFLVTNEGEDDDEDEEDAIRM